MIDEGPSAEDLDRFGGDLGHCPQCGAEVWDDAPACPACGVWIEGGTSARPPQVASLRRRVFLVVALTALGAFLAAVLALS